MPYKSRAQQRLFYARAKKSKKWANMAEEFSRETNFNKLSERKTSKDGYIKTIKRRPK